MGGEELVGFRNIRWFGLLHIKIYPKGFRYSQRKILQLHRDALLMLKKSASPSGVGGELCSCEAQA
jgi:hypothetical protein